MKQILIKTTLFIFFIAAFSFKTDKPAYLIFDKEGKKVDYKEMIQSALNCDVVFFGELHDNPICHWLELEVATSLFDAKKADLMMGSEIFETDNQLIVNEYVEKKIKASSFEAEAKLWKNYKSDYRALLNYARDHQIPFIATNVPRRYASKVNASGFEALDSVSREAKSYFAPMPIQFDAELDCYKKMLEKDTSATATGSTHSSLNTAKAQALKDATMANSIAEAWKKGKLFYHINGSYHSDNFESIIWHLKHYKKNLKILTISTIEKKGDLVPDSSEVKLADYIISIPENMSKSY